MHQKPNFVEEEQHINETRRFAKSCEGLLKMKLEVDWTPSQIAVIEKAREVII
jgi:hypothetical protein